MDDRAARVAELRRISRLRALSPAEVEELKDIRASINADLAQIEAALREGPGQ